MRKTISFRPASEELEARIDKKAEDLGLSRNAFMNDALELYTSVDAKLIKGIQGLAAELRLTAADIIQRRLSHWMGNVDAYAEIYGSYPDYFSDTVTLGSFEEDYSMHKKKETERLEKKILKEALECEALGEEEELADYEKAILIKYRQGKAWRKSEEYGRDKEMQKFVESVLTGKKS